MNTINRENNQTANNSNNLLGYVNCKEMTAQEIIDMINALSKVVEANKGWLGSDSTMQEANKKIKLLMKLIV